MNSLKKLLACSLLLSLCSMAMGQGIDFKSGTWDEIKAMAAESDKPIFVDAYTTWCGPCKWMAANL
ncbi:MAG: thioredoxin family protein, partial [Bacteroidota bacterium]